MRRARHRLDSAEVFIVFTLQHLAAIAALRSSDVGNARLDRARAAQLAGYVSSRLTELGVLREFTEQQEYEKSLAALDTALGADHLDQLMAEGPDWDEEYAVAQASLV